MAGLLDYLQNQKPVTRKGEGSHLRQQFPKLYGALGGLLGTAPDEFEGSILDPLTAQVRQGAEMGYLPGLIAGGAPPMKGAAGLGALAGMFVGKGSKTWDALQASKAMQLEKAGVDARKIWTETGNWKGPDGAWRQEIPDNAANLSMPTKQTPFAPKELSATGRLGNFLDHDPVFDAYQKTNSHQALERIPTTIRDNADGGGAYITPKFGEEIDAAGWSPKDAKSTLMHEIQHAIQNREGFAPGGRDFLNAGEAEARATQARIPLDAAQRRALFPADSYDVPMDQLIIRGNGNGPSMSTGLLDTKPFVYPQGKALETAQRNAAKPISEGGLGLPKNNTPMDRAKAMGFEEAYHGTDKVFSEFSTKGRGKTTGAGAFFTDNPSVASTYTSGVDGGNVIPSMIRKENPVVIDAKGKNWNRLGKQTQVNAPKISIQNKADDQLMADLFGEALTPTIVNKKAINKRLGKLFPDEFRFDDSFSTDDLASWANKEGYGSVQFNAVRDQGPTGTFANAESILPSTNTAVFNPSAIRSRFAAFDPARRNEADILGRADPELLKILAAATGGGLLGYNALNER